MPHWSEKSRDGQGHASFHDALMRARAVRLVFCSGQREGMEAQTGWGGLQVVPSPSHPQKHPEKGNAEGPYAGRGGQEVVSK